MEKIDVAIIGAGVVGLAIARELSKDSPRTIAVLESNPRFGQETSSRNSEVIHSGLYYPSSMLKTRLCLEGNRLLYDFCRGHKVKHFATGKLVISGIEEGEDKLDPLIRQARANDVAVEPLSKRQLKNTEPLVEAGSGFLVPSTGIIDSHGLMQALYYLARESRVVFLFNTPLLNAEYDGNAYRLTTPRERIKADILINAAGLGASRIAAMLGLDIDHCGYRLHPCKGEYFKIQRRFPVKHLVYPLPGPMSLGIHLTIDTGGGLRLGPNAFYVNDINYMVNEEHRLEFFQAAVQYLPFIQLGDLAPDFAGVRPKLQEPGEDPRDFVIREETDRRLPGLINLIGIESPGLTSSLAIGRYVSNILGG
ncbi:MAG: NAD(P)/FAD-dependent oxidoreductase [Syntrophomonas sp.]